MGAHCHSPSLTELSTIGSQKEAGRPEQSLKSKLTASEVSPCQRSPRAHNRLSTSSIAFCCREVLLENLAVATKSAKRATAKAVAEMLVSDCGDISRKNQSFRHTKK